MTWVPLSERSGNADPDGPFDGVPDHLHGPLAEWANNVAGELETLTLETIMLRLRVPNRFGALNRSSRIGMIATAFDDEQKALDLIDALLHHGARAYPDSWSDGSWPDDLSVTLRDGGSMWTPSPEGDRLVMVVDERMEKVYEQAVSVEDPTTKELREAWANAYGRNGDTSDAWDHAIKTIESVLIPIVVPNMANATLGHVLGQLEGQSTLWKMALPGRDQSEDVKGFVEMLRLIWPNHDRHNPGRPAPVPTVEQARMVVTFAAMLVQWRREGNIVSRR
ncbi:hypothetical protein AB0M12_02055 [Nocardia vinacea]|uniref:hypothetical protein n=1 Tax=Nocardia vinacea TaxID=96468 RepID=UPI003430D382